MGIVRYLLPAWINLCFGLFSDSGRSTDLVTTGARVYTFSTYWEIPARNATTQCSASTRSNHIKIVVEVRMETSFMSSITCQK